MSRIIAVDFDGTLCEDRYPGIGAPKEDVIERLKQARYSGAKLILCTCRSGDLLYEARSWCANYGLYFDAANENLPETLRKYPEESRKVYATEYWDDKAVRIK